MSLWDDIRSVVDGYETTTQQTIKTLSDEISSLNSNIAALNETVVSQKSEIDARDAQILDLTQQVSTLKEQLDNLSKKPSDGLWFAKDEKLLGNSKKVFAHWFPPYPNHINNVDTRALTYYAKNYYTINGESGAHAATGGLLDNGPIWSGKLTVPNAEGQSLEVQDGIRDITNASNYGYDGFMVDVITKSTQQATRYTGLLDAASYLKLPNFYVVPMVDCNGSIVNSLADTANAVELFWGRPSTWMIDGKMVVSSFRGENKTAAWWQQLKDDMQNRGKPITLWLGFLNFGSASGYSGITIGEGAWGEGSDPVTVAGIGSRTATSHSRGKKYLHPIQGQSIRRSGKKWEESSGLDGINTHWDCVISQQPDAVQVVTWNDYTEGGESAPSEARGYVPLSIDCYRMHEYKLGYQPKILADELIIAHPSMLRSTQGSQQIDHMVQWDRGLPRSQAKNIVQVNCYLKDAATVQVTVGGQTTTHQQPAGYSVIEVALAAGSNPSARLIRNNKVVAEVVSIAPVKSIAKVDDRQYYLTSAIQQQTGLAQGQQVSVEL